MPKIHARMSVEIDVTEAEFKEIVAKAKDKDGEICDTEIPYWVVLCGDRVSQCDWDDGGYIPGPWLEDDIAYERDCNHVEVE